MALKQSAEDTSLGRTQYISILINRIFKKKKVASALGDKSRMEA